MDFISWLLVGALIWGIWWVIWGKTDPNGSGDMWDSTGGPGGGGGDGGGC